MTSPRPGLLFLINSLAVGGAEKQVVTLLNHLDTRRFRLHLACLRRSEQLLPQLRLDRLDELLWCNLQRALDRHAIDRLRSLIGRRQIDAVICTNRFPMLQGYLATRVLDPRPKLVTVFHSTKLLSLRERAYTLLYRHLFTRCDALVYVSENQRGYWRGHGLSAANDTVVYNGIDVEHFTDGYTEEQKHRIRDTLGFAAQDYVVGLCSSLRLEKSPQDLLCAIARLRSRNIPAKALFIGDGPQRAAVERTAATLGIREHIRITGTQRDVRPFIACSDVMTLVSRSETFSLAALEAMSLGKPLVMSDVGGASEQIVHAEDGFLFDPGDIDALCLHLSALTSEDLRRQMGESAGRRVRRLFRADAMTEGFSRRIDQLLRKSAGPPGRSLPAQSPG